MAYGSNPGNPGGGGGDMYSDAPMDEMNKEGKKGEDKSQDQTYLVPSAICPGMKAGEEMVVKINRVMDDQYEISYAPKEEGGDEKEAESPMPNYGGDKEMAGMME
jgi:hypothetical protein